MNKPKIETLEKTSSQIISLEAWVESVFTPPKNDKGELGITVNLSQYGLKTTNDVIAFLKSPAGALIQAEIGEELSQQEFNQETQRLILQESNLFTHRLRALLFLWFIEKNAHAASKVNELIRQQNEKTLEEAEKALTKKRKTSSTVQESIDPLSSYTKALNLLTAELDLNHHKNQSLHLLKEHIEMQSQRITSRYHEYETYLSSLELSTHGKADLSEQEIASKITSISGEIEVLALDISKLLDDGHEEHAKELLNKQNALNLQITTLLDMRAVHQGEKYYVNSDGEQVDSFKDAHFVLKRGTGQSHEQSVVKVDGKLYLLKPGQNWNSIKENIEAKEQARQDYKLSKREIMSVKKVVQYNKGFETKNQHDRLNEVEKKLELNQDEKMQLQNQVILIQAARSIAERMLVPLLTPKPTPSAKFSATPTLKPTQAPTSASYKERLDLLKKSTHLTKEDLLNLATQAPGANRRIAVDFLLQEFTGLSRKASIPLTTMKRLLIDLERFGVEPKNEITPKRPSPFKTTPEPFSK